MQLMSQDANWCWSNVECSNVPMIQWSNVQMFKYSNVPMNLWSNVPMCFSFHKVARVFCPLVYWSIGPLVHWSIGPLVHWFNVKCQTWNIICQMSNIKNQMSNVDKVILLSERTAGVPPVIFMLCRHRCNNRRHKWLSAKSWFWQ